MREPFALRGPDLAAGVPIASVQDGKQLPQSAWNGLDTSWASGVCAGRRCFRVNTEFRLAWRRGLENALQTHPSEIAPYKLQPFDLILRMTPIGENLKDLD